MKIERLNVGWFTAPAGIFRAGDDMDRTVRFPVPAYVVETATERIPIRRSVLITRTAISPRLAISTVSNTSAPPSHIRKTP